MRASLLSACALAALVSLPGVAAAQVVHAGVDADALTPAGLARVDGTVPASADAPVRLVYAAQTSARPELMIPVLVARDAAGARAALARFRQGVQAALTEAREAGDVSVRVDDAQLAFVRDNVFVAVRRIEGTRDVLAVARDVDGVVRASPVGAPPAAQLSLTVGPSHALRGGREKLVALDVSGALVLSAERGLRAADVRAVRAGLAPYQTSRGWFVRVRADRTVTAAEFAVTGVDPQLRVTAR